MPLWPIIKTGVIQGFGMGFVFIPLSTLAFTTLPASYRNEGTSVMSLMRNVGSSVGISIVMTLLSRNTQISHADLSANLVPFGNAGVILKQVGEAMAGFTDAPIFGMLNAEVTKQAVTISYLDDFRFMMWLVVLVLVPLTLMLKGQKRAELEKIEEETPEELYAAAE
jgi:DHA2 family multidrug resistance protein